MLASGLRHPRIKSAQASLLHPALHAAKKQVCATLFSPIPVMLSLLRSEGRAKEERRRSKKEPQKEQKETKTIR
jgi:hypothetical protein